MAELGAIEAYCNELLQTEKHRDAAVNGVQVGCRQDVRKLVTGVTASAALIKQAVQKGAQMVLAHHGLFWEGQSPALKGGLLTRVRLLVEHDMALLAYHLPLDAHPELGNNAVLARSLGLSEPKPWGTYKDAAIGVEGRLKPTPVDELVRSISRLVDREVLHFPGGPEQVERVAVVSGGAAMMALDAASQGFDLFLTGEPAETCMHVAEEESIHIVAAGHHATEVFGVRALADHLAQHFGLEAVHVDIPNPV